MAPCRDATISFLFFHTVLWALRVRPPSKLQGWKAPDGCCVLFLCTANIFFPNQYFKLTKNIESWIHLNPGRINSQLLPGTVTDARDIKGETDRRSEGQRHLHLANSHYRVSLRLFWTTDWSSVPEPEPQNSLGYRWKAGPCWPGVTPWVQFDSAVWGSVGVWHTKMSHVAL